MKHGLNSSGYFFTNQFTDDCLWCGMGSRSFYPQPIGGNGVYKNDVPCVFSKEAAFSITGYFGGIFRPVFVKSVVFFIGQVFVFHKDNIA